MDSPYRPSKYALRAPPPIPPRPGSVGIPATDYDRRPPLPPRPSFVTGDPHSEQSQAQPPPYEYQPATYQDLNESLYSNEPVGPGLPQPDHHENRTPRHARSSPLTPSKYVYPPPPRQPPPSMYPVQPAPPGGVSENPSLYPAPGEGAYRPEEAQIDSPLPQQLPTATDYDPSAQSYTPRKTAPFPPQPPEQEPYVDEQLVPSALFSGTRQAPVDSASSWSQRKPEQEPTRSEIHRDNDQMPRKTPTPRSKIQYDPPAKYTLRKCPTTEYNLTGPGTWFIHPEVPEFLICTYCYDKHILPTHLSNSFDSFTSPGGAKPQCFFSSARIEDVLVPRALTSGSLTELVQFFARRLSLSTRACPGEGNHVAASAGVKWFQLNENSRGRFPQFRACEVCYEDTLLASPLRDEFVQITEPQGEDILRTCDVALPFIKKLARNEVSLDAFITQASRHLLDLPQCAKGGELVNASSRRWYTPRPEIIPSAEAEEITICERCYQDFMFHNDFRNDFQLVTLPPYASDIQRRCVLGFYQSRTVLEETLASNDRSLWHRTMATYVKTPPCTLLIRPGTQIYHVPGVENFGACHSCYVGLIQPHGLDVFFQLLQRSPSDTAQLACDLNPSHLRFPQYAYKLDEALITGTFSIFTTFVSGISTADPCPKLELVKNRPWYGVPNCRICPPCYEEICRGTYLSQFIPPTPETLPANTDNEDGIHCDLYSTRMRSKWRESCKLQSPPLFFEFAALRKQTYDQTVPEMRMIVMLATHQLNMQRMHNTTSTFYNAMDGASAWQYNPNIRYTGGGGTFATPWGVTGALEGNLALGGMQGVIARTARVELLQEVWDAVE
ncbi:hypothetical protein BJX99DRAFT_263037 [Aspergillus californicus]